MVLAVDDLPQAGFLSVPGASAADIFLDKNGSPAFRPVLDDVLADYGYTFNSADHLYLQDVFAWATGPGDPGAFARYVATEQLDDLVQTGQKIPLKKVVIALGEQDTTIPVHLGEYLAGAFYPDATDYSTYVHKYTGQGHGTLLSPDPDAGAQAAMQTQMLTFLMTHAATGTGTVCTPEYVSNTYTGNCN
jgi:hypothetical protein